jgi:DNA-binding GntR family transcriptional regulator
MTAPVQVGQARLARAGLPRKTPARIFVYAAIRGAIVRAELAPGSQLSENELAEQLGVSRTPVREALARLRDDRLVEVVPQLGTFVSRISFRALGEAQFIREALECAAVKRGAELAGEEDVAALEGNLAAQKRATESDDLEAWYLLDDAYHRMLCDLSGHPTVWSVSERAKSHINRVRRISLLMPDYLAQRLSEHREIAEAVAAHEGERAEQIDRKSVV